MKKISKKGKFRLSRYPSDENAQPILVPRKNISWEAKAVFNPSVVLDGNVFRMLYRTYPDKLEETMPRLTRPGFRFAIKHRISATPKVPMVKILSRDKNLLLRLIQIMTAMVVKTHASQNLATLFSSPIPR